GVTRGFRDHAGQWRETPVETAVALLAALGRPAPTAAQAQAALLDQEAARLPQDVICAPGSRPDLGLDAWRLTLEDGTQAEGRGLLPHLPLGIHRLKAGGQHYTLLCAPPHLPAP